MWNEILPAGAQWLPVSAAGAIVSALLLCVSAWRKWKSGEIEDDGILIKRLLAEIDRLNIELERKRIRARARDDEIDELRKSLRHVEDKAAIYYRQLEIAKIRPEEEL